LATNLATANLMIAGLGYRKTLAAS